MVNRRRNDSSASGSNQFIRSLYEQRSQRAIPYNTYYCKPPSRCHFLAFFFQRFTFGQDGRANAQIRRSTEQAAAHALWLTTSANGGKFFWFSNIIYSIYYLLWLRNFFPQPCQNGSTRAYTRSHTATDAASRLHLLRALQEVLQLQSCWLPISSAWIARIRNIGKQEKSKSQSRADKAGKFKTGLEKGQDGRLQTRQTTRRGSKRSNETNLSLCKATELEVGKSIHPAYFVANTTDGKITA